MRSDFARQLHHGQILHDNRVGAGFGDGGETSGCILQFGIENQRIISDVAFDAAPP